MRKDSSLSGLRIESSLMARIWICVGGYVVKVVDVFFGERHLYLPALVEIVKTLI